MTKQVTGTVVSLIAGFYDVQTGADVVRTRARGVFRKRNEKPAVGDHVVVELNQAGTNYLVQVQPRLNRIGRPAVANVHHILLVISAVQPAFSLILLDRFLTFFAWQHVGVTIYLSKTDLIQEQDSLVKINHFLAYYQRIGYQIFTKRQKLAQFLSHRLKQGEIWTLAGQSGAGKSTLLNYLKKGAHQATGSISPVLNRGKHTTRTVRLFQLGNGFLADTPGFSAINLSPIKLKELGRFFLEFKKVSQQCKFRGCQHLKEPGCKVKRLVKQGKILASRYADYLTIRQEIKDSRIPEYLK